MKTIQIQLTDEEINTIEKYLETMGAGTKSVREYLEDILIMRM